MEEKKVEGNEEGVMRVVYEEVKEKKGGDRR